MKFGKNIIRKKRYEVISAIIVFIIMTVISLNVIFNYSKIYEDMQYADMITCSDSLDKQVYSAIMKPFSRVLGIGEIVSNAGIEIVNNNGQMQGLISDSGIKGILFAPNDKIEAVFPQDSMASYLGMDLSKDFPETIEKNVLRNLFEPIIIGPYSTDKNTFEMAAIAPFYNNTRFGREYAGHVAVVVDYPGILKDVDFSVVESKKMLCRVWRYNEYTSKVQTLLETKDKFPEVITKNQTTFQKLYFTSFFNYSFVPKYNFVQTRDFYLLVIGLLIVTILATFAVYQIWKGIKHSSDLKLYKIQSELLKIQEHIIISLSNLVENRDSDTGEHVRRTSDYVYMIATEAKKAGIYTDILTDEYINMLKNAAPMHDIGKIVIPDAVLKKQGKLTPEEFEQIKTHTIEGGKIISDIVGPVQSPEFVTITQEIATSHHEKWNGKGYPYGLKENEIPLSARIMSLADVFDALTTPRCYKEPFSFEKSIEIIQQDRGIAFDPQLTNIFLANQDKLREIMNAYLKDK